MAEPQGTTQSISNLANKATNARRRAEQSTGLSRLEAAIDGLAAAEMILEQTRGVRDREGRENLDRLISVLHTLRLKGVAETKVIIQRLLTLAGTDNSPKEKRTGAIAAIEAMYAKFPLDFTDAVAIREKISQITVQ